jgi:hypothetical protein
MSPVNQAGKTHVKAGRNLTPESLPVAANIARAKHETYESVPKIEDIGIGNDSGTSPQIAPRLALSDQ